jgi:hypothetical protein
MTNHHSHPALSGAYQGRRINAPPTVAMSRYLVQGTAIGGAPPGNFSNEVVGNSVQVQTSNGQVEEGMISRRPSMMSALPPYSLGEFQRDDGVPPLLD